MIILKKLIFFFIMSLFVFIAVWKQVTVFSSASLQGVYETVPRAHFSVSSFMNNGFQEQFSYYVEDLRGLKGVFTRIRNQVDYTLFLLPHANKIVRGKNGYLFGEENVLAYLGKDFPGEHYLDVKIRELKLFQDELWEKKKILLIVIFTPDKASFFPQFLPERYLKKRQKLNNYLYYSKKCTESRINVIDFNRYFILARDTSRYPLFTKTGVHWSSYGAIIAADSLIRYLGEKLFVKLPKIVIDRIRLSRVPKDEDDDISRTMNLMWRISQPELAYPKFHFISEQATVRPSALFIGDSYYWNWYKPGIIRNIFRNTEFWYYDKEVYPESFFNTCYTWHINLKNSIERQDVIILLQTNNGEGYDFGYGFVDRAWPEYDPSENNRIRSIEAVLTKAPENMKIYEKKSQDLNAPIESVIRADAIFAGNNLLRKNK
jgi:hypothetical protein